jgi:hypothetical protein
VYILVGGLQGSTTTISTFVEIRQQLNKIYSKRVQKRKLFVRQQFRGGKTPSTLMDSIGVPVYSYTFME